LFNTNFVKLVDWLTIQQKLDLEHITLWGTCRNHPDLLLIGILRHQVVSAKVSKLIMIRTNLVLDLVHILLIILTKNRKACICLVKVSETLQIFLPIVVQSETITILMMNLVVDSRENALHQVLVSTKQINLSSNTIQSLLTISSLDLM